MSKVSNIEILMSDHRGIYIPQHFAQECAELWNGIDADDLAVLLAGPDHEWYWEAWDNVLTNAEATLDGKTFTLFHDGDLFAIAENELTSEERIAWGWDGGYGVMA